MKEIQEIYKTKIEIIQTNSIKSFKTAIDSSPNDDTSFLYLYFFI